MTQHTYDKAAAAAELEAFKSANLVDLAVAMGWTVTEKGTAGAKVTKGAMKIAIFKGSAAWMWKSFHGEGPAGRMSGTVVDLAIEETGSIGKARQFLRSLTGASAPTSTPYTTHAPVSVSTSPNSAYEGKTYKSSDEVLAEFQNGSRIWQPGDRLPPFMSERGVRSLPAVFNGRFAVTTDHHRAARFLYVNFDDDGRIVAAGSEDRNLAREPGAKSYRSYSENGRAGFWHAPGDTGAPVVVVEGPLEAISFELIRREMGQDTGEQIGYVSVRSGGEEAVIRYLKAKISTGTQTIVLATNQDPAGMLYAHKIMLGLAKSGALVRYLAPPETHNDWNDGLKAHRAREAGSESRSNGGLSPRPEPRPAPRTRTPDPTAPCPS